jgi:hypothetical protein
VTIPVQRSAYTVNWLLSGQQQQLAEGLARTLDEFGRSGRLGALSSQGIARLHQQFSATVGAQLDIDLGTILIDGWRVHRALVEAAHATLANPAAAEVVELGTHSIALERDISIDVVVNGKTVATVPFQLATGFEVDRLLGTVRQGHLMDIQVGQCFATVALSCAGVQLAAGRAPLTPVTAFNLAMGVPLIAVPMPASAPPAPAAPNVA